MNPDTIKSETGLSLRELMTMLDEARAKFGTIRPEERVIWEAYIKALENAVSELSSQLEGPSPTNEKTTPL